MPSYCKIVMIGHLTRDVELRYLQAGTAVANYTVAINRTWKDAQGECREEVSFVDCSAFAGRAEVMAKYLRKGDPLLVEGHLRQENWEDKQTGKKKSRLRVVTESIVFLGQKRRDERQDPVPGQPPPELPADQPATNDGSGAAGDDNIPF